MPEAVSVMVGSSVSRVGMIRVNGNSNGEVLVGDTHVLLTYVVSSVEGDIVKAFIQLLANFPL